MEKIFVSKKHKLHKIWKNFYRSETWKSAWLSYLLYFYFLYFPSLAASKYNFFFQISPLQSSTRTDLHSKMCGDMTLSFKKTRKPTLIKKVKFFEIAGSMSEFTPKAVFFKLNLGTYFGWEDHIEGELLAGCTGLYCSGSTRFMKGADSYPCIFIKNSFLQLNFSEN